MGLFGIILSLIGIVGDIISFLAIKSIGYIPFIFAGVAVIGIIISAVGIRKGPKGAAVIGMILSCIALVGGLVLGGAGATAKVITDSIEKGEIIVVDQAESAVNEIVEEISSKVEEEGIENVVQDIVEEIATTAEETPAN